MGGDTPPNDSGDLPDRIGVSGPRTIGGAVGRCLFALALGWAVFQLYIASPLPYLVGGAFIVNATQARAVHYAFIIFFVFCLYPASRRSDKLRIPAVDWILGTVGALTALYLLYFNGELARRAGAPTLADIWVSMLGLIFLFEAVRRTIGLPLLIVSALFCVYAFAGPYMPTILLHHGVSLGRFADQMWLSAEGVFGIPLGVSNSLIFLYVLFGALLEQMGAGRYLVRLASSLLGHLRGGPAKACIVASAAMGTVSGSTVANILTTGTFTIPLMRRVGYPPEKAAAIETSASIDGQLMPPVMGAAAFLMTEFVGIPYVEVIKHAFLPAVLSYIALYYIVHLEAVKLGLPAVTRPGGGTLSAVVHRVARFVLVACSLVIIAGAVYYGLGWVKGVTGAASPYVMAALFFVAHAFLLKISAETLSLSTHNPGVTEDSSLNAGSTTLSGLHYLLPIFVLIWCLIVERYSPSLSVMWSIAAAAWILVMQMPLLAFLRREPVSVGHLKRGCADLLRGMAAGSFNMVGMGMALASAGIIVGVVSLTGVGLAMTSLIGNLAGDSLLAVLLCTALASIVLGTGLPTTANYIVVSAIMAPAIVDLAAQGGLVVPLIGAHLFIFYFGLLSGTTPPVAIDAFAAAAVANTDPFKVCMQSFYYSMRTVIVPFCFVFNPALLLIGVESIAQFALVVSASVLATLLFVAVTQGYFLARSRYIESGLLLVAAFTLFVPTFWVDRVQQPFENIPLSQLEPLTAGLPDDARIRMWVAGTSFTGKDVQKAVVLPLGKRGASGTERLERSAGLSVRSEDGLIIVSEVRPYSPAEGMGISRHWQVAALQAPAERIAEEWFYLPAIFLGAFVAWRQWLRLPSRRTAHAT